MSSVVIVASLAESVSNFRAPLVRRMVQHGLAVTAVAPDLDSSSRSAIAELGARAELVRFARTGMNPVKDLLGIVALYRFFRREKPRYILAYTAKPVNYGLLAARFAGVPTRSVMITGLGYAFTEGGEGRRKIARMAARFLYGLSLPRATSIIFQNPDDVALFREQGLLSAASPVHLVNGSGVDCSQYAVSALPERPHFLMIARLLKDKGVREYAEAAARLRAQVPGATTSLVGWIDESPNSITRNELDGWCAAGLNFLGRLSDVRPAIAQASVVVLPSYREGTPRSVLEGMAMGRAIITTDAPGCRETVEPGVNGLLVTPRDAAALAQAMIALARDPARVVAMGTQSRRIAKEKYDADAVALDTLRKAGILPAP